MIRITNYQAISQNEKNEILLKIKDNNFAIYDIGKTVSLEYSKKFIIQLANIFNLINIDNHLCTETDGISIITESQQYNKKRYIPYSNKKIDWHTDGYYNLPNNTIRSLILHCVSPADQGGISQIINHQLIYQKIKSYNPEFIEILSQPNVMTIPANIVNGKIIRQQISVAVFDHDKDGHLIMRYTTRKTNIIWDKKAKIALDYLKKLLKDKSYINEIKLQAGQGIITNNALHKRTKFVDNNSKRVLLRARYYNLIIV